VGTFIQSGGTNSIEQFTVGNSWSASGTGTYFLSGPSLLTVSETETVGWGGVGGVNQSGGTNVASVLWINCLIDVSGGNYSGTYNLGGGQLSAGTEVIQASGGLFLQTGGTNTVTGQLEIDYGQYQLNGGILSLSAVNGSGATAFNFGGGTLQASSSFTTTLPMTLTGSGGNATVDTAGFTVTFSGSLSGPGGLTKTDSGALVLAASNTYTGGTTVMAGILVASNGSNGSATGSGTVTLSGGTLASGSGGGTIAGPVAIGSVASEIAPGGIGSIGKLTIGSLLTASNLTTLNFDLTTPGGNGDLLMVTGNLTLAPNTAITLGSDPTAYGDYRLIGYGSLTGSLGDFELPPAPPNTAYTLSTTVDPGYIDLVVAVPEPSTLVLLGIAAAGLLACAWRRKRSG
jgi:autotransporter-associated beta strand protein